MTVNELFGIKKVVTHTTRDKRVGEVQGIDYHFVSKEKLEDLRADILFNADNKAYVALCPICGSKLITRIAKLYDLEDNLILHPKARCSKCPFQLHS